MIKRTSVRRQLVVAVLAGAMVSGGCVRTVTHRAARFEPEAAGAGEAATAATTQPVSAAAVWKVKVREHGEKEYHGIDGTERLLQRGDVVGFRKGEDGVIYAVVNKEQIPLALTEDHRRVVWQAREKKTTDFAMGMAEVGQVAAQVLAVVATVAVIGGLLVLSAAAENDCDDSTY